jgi:hypothetical protein
LLGGEYATFDFARNSARNQNGVASFQSVNRLKAPGGVGGGQDTGRRCIQINLRATGGGGLSMSECLTG